MSARPTGTGCRLYIITPERLDLGSFPDALARALDAGDVFAVQLRLKTADDGTWKRAIEALLPVCRSPGTALLLNDRPDLVVATGCDGAHVGQTDMPARAARSVMGPGHARCHVQVVARSRSARHRDGADYVAFGAFFPSTSKQVTALADPEVLRLWSAQSASPSFAIGGITAANLAPLVRARANLLAIIGGVWSHPDGPAAGVRAINAAIKFAAQE